MSLKRFENVAIAAWLALVGVVSVAGSAKAMPVDFPLKDGAFDTGWKATFDDAQVKNPGFAGAGAGRSRVFSVDEIFTSLNPIEIKFSEINKAADDDFGLRLTMKKNVTNSSKVDWAAFKIELIDTNPVLTEPPIPPRPRRPNDNDSVSDFHKGFAHFHNQAQDGAQAFPPFKNPAKPNSVNAYDLTGGIFKDDGHTETWTGIGIHQIEAKGQQRNFVMKETPSPVPEPATLLLWGTTIAGLGLTARWRRRRQT